MAVLDFIRTASNIELMALIIRKLLEDYYI